MRVAIYYSPEEKRWVTVLAAFVRGLCGEGRCEIVAQEEK